MMANSFKEYVSKNNIIYLVIVKILNLKVESFGKKEELPHIGLYNNLFGGKENILKLNDSLKGQIMPQSWKQGELKCLVVKPNDEVLIGVFYIDSQDAIESYKRGKEIDIQLIELLKANENANSV